MSVQISIITAVFNGERFLQKFFESVIKQSRQHYELIIIDGGSKDKSVALIKEYEKYISYWISEPDKGIYDAWNKGIEKASGNWIMFLGCDDMLVSNALDKYIKIIAGLKKNEEIDFISSRVQIVDSQGNLIRLKGGEFKWPLFLKEMTFAHPGALHAKKLFEKYGRFNVNYKIVGDYEFFLRVGRELRDLFINETTVIMSENGASDSIAAIKEHYKAVTTTGKYPAGKAFINALIVSAKFKIKKLARKVGLNLYLNKT